MASNPMQRKARNSFLLGMVLAILIAAIPVVFLYMKNKDLNEKIQADKQLLRQVYVLNQDIKSGQTVTSDMFSLSSVTLAGVPSNATSDIISELSSYALCDKAGNEINTDENGKLYLTENGKKVEIIKEENTDNYYKVENNNKVYVELTEKPLIAKIDLKKNTIVTTKYLARSDEMTTNDTRTQSYSMIVLPSNLSTGDFIDIRYKLPDGRDYIVLSKKEAEVPMYNGTYSTDTINLTMREDELLILSSAIVDAYRTEGSELYAIKYVEPGNQEAAKTTYTVSQAIWDLIRTDANILNEAKEGLKNRYLSFNSRTEIQNAITGDEASVVSGVQESVTKKQEERQKYLDSLGAGTEY